VPADVLAQADELSLGGEETGGVEPSRRGEGGLLRPQPRGQRLDDRERDAQPTVDPGGLDRDRLERTLAADAAG
jgi:hypothetical protein